MTILHGVNIPDTYREWSVQVDRDFMDRTYRISARAYPLGMYDTLCAERRIQQYQMEMYSNQELVEYIHYELENFLRMLDEHMRDFCLRNPDARFRPPRDFAPRRQPVRTITISGYELVPEILEQLDTQRFGEALRQSLQTNPRFIGVDHASEPDQTVEAPKPSKRKKSLVEGKLCEAENPAALKVGVKAKKLRLRK